MLTKSPKNMTMEENAEWLLNPRSTLDPRIFDSDNKMLPKVRDELLFRANVLKTWCLDKLPGIEVADIVLQGSSASYIWHEFSDLDVKLIVNYDACPLWDAKKGGDKRAFISRCVKAIYSRKISFELEGRFVDIGVIFQPYDFQQTYSILQNKWLIEANTYFWGKADKEKVLAKAKKLILDLENTQGDKFEKINGGYDLEDIEEASRYWDSVLNMKRYPGSFFINKLVCYDERYRKFKNHWKKEKVKFLSF
ncbi:MAG: hypothetical protein E7019_06070 [Alphaproteobacteria bacterium]|nr:hypothetical protein [Alphaproteobacteria bacterium]